MYSKLFLIMSMTILMSFALSGESYADVREREIENPPGSGKFKKMFAVSPGSCDGQPDGTILHQQQHANGIYKIKCHGNSIVESITDSNGNEVYVGKCPFPNGHNFIYKKYQIINGASYLNFTAHASLDVPAAMVLGTNYTNLPDVEYSMNLTTGDFMTRNTTHWIIKNPGGFRFGVMPNSTGGLQETHGTPPSTPDGLKFPRSIAMSMQDFRDIGSFALSTAEFERFSDNFEQIREVPMEESYVYEPEPMPEEPSEPVLNEPALSGYALIIVFIVIISAGIYISFVFGRKR
jgi:hypothetical protein